MAGCVLVYFLLVVPLCYDNLSMLESGSRLARVKLFTYFLCSFLFVHDMLKINI